MKEPSARRLVQNARRIILKVGSSVLTGGGRTVQPEVIRSLASQIALLQSSGRTVLLVTSGAVATGRDILGLPRRSLSIPEKQAAAACGQGRLIHLYQTAFEQHGLLTAQILLTRDDLTNRRRYLNAKHTIETLLARNVVPIINENDSVVVSEIKFGDNDTLSALIAPVVDADLLILLSDVDGLFEAPPKDNPHAKRIPSVSKIDPQLLTAASEEGNHVGVGGMRTKVEAARRATELGTACIIASGHEADILTALFRGEDKGTIFLPSQDRLQSRKHWILHTLKSKGSLTVDAGAVNVLQSSGKSLLPSGITRRSGDFDVGDAIEILDENGNAFAKGLTNYSADEIDKIRGQKSTAIESILGFWVADEVIHRDDLVLMQTEE